jgi:hypothetical protein
MSNLIKHSLFSLILLGLLAHSEAAHAGPTDPVIDKALDCLSGTTVSYFNASATTVQPFKSTTLSWSANVPYGCSVSFKVAGKSVSKKGSLTVTPIHATSTYSLQATMAGVTGSLSTRKVYVNTSACRTVPVWDSLIVPQVSAKIDEVDAEDDDFYQRDEPAIWTQSSGLFVTMFIKGAHWWWDPSIDLEMGLRFYARNGVVYPAWTKFHPIVDSSLPDAEVAEVVYDKAPGILAEFKDGFNSGLAELVGDDEDIFDVKTADSRLDVTICPVPLMVWGTVVFF